MDLHSYIGDAVFKDLNLVFFLLVRYHFDDADEVEDFGATVAEMVGHVLTRSRIACSERVDNVRRSFFDRSVVRIAKFDVSSELDDGEVVDLFGFYQEPVLLFVNDQLTVDYETVLDGIK